MTVLIALRQRDLRVQVVDVMNRLGVATVLAQDPREQQLNADYRLVDLESLRDEDRDLPTALLALPEQQAQGLELLARKEIFDLITVRQDADELSLRLQVLVAQRAEIQEVRGHQRAWHWHKRFLKTLLECQQSLLRANDEQALFQDICRLIVEHAEYCLAWVGLAEQDGERRVVPVAWSGQNQGYLESIKITWDQAPTAQGPTGQAVREGSTVACQDFLSDPIMAPWREAARQRGFRSSLALPLIDEWGQPLGALTVYSPLPQSFEPEVVAPFEQLAKDLALGLTAVRHRQARLKSQAELERMTRQLHHLTASSPTVLYALTLDCGDWIASAVSQNVERMTGYSVEQALNPGWWTQGVHPEDVAAVQQRFEQAIRQGTGSQEYRFRHADGHYLWVLDEIRKVGDDQIVGSWTDISSLKASREALILSEHRYRDLFMSNPQPMYVVDRETLRFLDVNPAALGHYGYTREQFLNLTIFDIRPASEESRVRRLLESVENGLGRVGILPHRKRNGEEILVDIAYHPLEFEGRAALLVLAHDVTRAEQARQSLEVQAHRAEALLQLPRLAEQLSESDFLQTAMEMTENLTGSQAGFVHFLQTDQRVWSRRTLETYPSIATDPSTELGQRFLSVPVIEAGQEVLHCGVADKAHDYDDLDLETVQLIANDLWRIIQRRRAQEQVLQLSRAVEQSPHSVVITDLEGNIQYVNDSFVRITGYARSEVIGQNPRILKSGLTPFPVYKSMWQALTQGEIWKGELHNRRKDGSIYVESAILCPIRQPDGRITHYVGLKEDITERQLLEAELSSYRHRLEELVERRTAELAEATRRAEAANLAKGTFLANMSHEIRTPLNAILGLSYLLRQSGLNPEQAQKLEQVDAAGRHLLAVINQILDLAKIEAGRFQLVQTDFDSRELLEDAARLVEGEAHEKGLELRVDADSPALALRGDVTRLRQALLNYLGNALKFTSSGSIRLGCRLEEDGPEPLLRFEVEDTGCGIEPEQLDRLFRKFEQLDSGSNRRHGGTGLGLAITARVAELMGGQVGVESRLGQGSRFWFSARLARSSGERKAPVVSSQELERSFSTLEDLLRARFRGARILLAEDHPVNLQVALELLTRVGLVVETAVNGREALSLFQSQGFDLLLVDLQMPELDGLEVARAIRQIDRGKSLPILAMTASVFQEDRDACRAAGMDDFVAKPVEPGELYTRVYRWLSGQTELPEGLLVASTTPQAGDQQAELLRIPGLDSQRALAACNGDAGRLLELLRQFLTDSQRELSPLRATDGPLLERPAHRVKGAAATLGALRMAELAGRLEEAARSGALCAQPLDLLKAEVSETLQALPNPPEQLQNPSTLPPGELVEKLLQLLAHGDAECLNLWQQYHSPLAALLGSRATEFARFMDRFQFEDAHRILQQLQ